MVVGREERGANGVVDGGMKVTKVVFVVSFWDKDMVDGCSVSRLGACVVLLVCVKDGKDGHHVVVVDEEVKEVVFETWAGGEGDIEVTEGEERVVFEFSRGAVCGEGLC